MVPRREHDRPGAAGAPRRRLTTADRRVPRCAVSPPRSSRAIPEPVRKVARTAIWGFGRATSRWRPLPDFLVHRRPEGGHDGALRVPPLASRDHRAVVEGGELLRPALVARAGVVPRAVPPAERDTARRRGEPELPLPPARARSASVRSCPTRDSSPSCAIPSTRVLALPARGRARPRAALVRGRARGGGRADARGGGDGSSPTPGPSAAPGGTTPTSRAGSTPTSSSAGSRSSRASSCSSSRSEELGERPAETYAVDPRVPRRARRTRSTSTRASSTATTPPMRAGDAARARRALRRAEPAARGAARARRSAGR